MSGFVVTVALAVAGAGLLGLVVGIVAGAWPPPLVALRASPYRLALRFDRGSAARLRHVLVAALRRRGQQPGHRARARSSSARRNSACRASASSRSRRRSRSTPTASTSRHPDALPAICAVRGPRRPAVRVLREVQPAGADVGRCPFGLGLALFAARPRAVRDRRALARRRRPDPGLRRHRGDQPRSASTGTPSTARAATPGRSRSGGVHRDLRPRRAAATGDRRTARPGDRDVGDGRREPRPPAVLPGAAVPGAAHRSPHGARDGADRAGRRGRARAASASRGRIAPWRWRWASWRSTCWSRPWPLCSWNATCCARWSATCARRRPRRTPTGQELGVELLVGLDEASGGEGGGPSPAGLGRARILTQLQASQAVRPPRSPARPRGRSGRSRGRR